MNTKASKIGIILLFILCLVACDSRKSASEILQEIEESQSQRQADDQARLDKESSKAEALRRQQEREGIEPEAEVSEEAESSQDSASSEEVDVSPEQDQTEDANQQSSQNFTKADANSQARYYLIHTSASEADIRQQLRVEGYSADEIDHAIAASGADWYEQAADRAWYYSETQNFSRAELVDQLMYDGFTAEQAEYGAAYIFGY